jgi:hypothetical protein
LAIRPSEGIFIDRQPPKAKATHIALFFDGCASVPQTQEKAAASANLPPGTCNGLTVGHGGCCHGKKWQSRWRVGRWQLMLVVACFVFFVFYVVFERPFSYRRGRKLKSAKAKLKIANFCAIIT